MRTEARESSDRENRPEADDSGQAYTLSAFEYLGFSMADY